MAGSVAWAGAPGGAGAKVENTTILQVTDGLARDLESLGVGIVEQVVRPSLKEYPVVDAFGMRDAARQIGDFRTVDAYVHQCPIIQFRQSSAGLALAKPDLDRIEGAGDNPRSAGEGCVDALPDMDHRFCQAVKGDAAGCRAAFVGVFVSVHFQLHLSEG